MSDEEYETLKTNFGWKLVEMALQTLNFTWIDAYKSQSAKFDVVGQRCQDINEHPKSIFGPILKSRGVNLEDSQYEVVIPSISQTNCHAFTFSKGKNIEDESIAAEKIDSKLFEEVDGNCDKRPLIAAFYKGSQLAHTAVLLPGEDEYQHKFVGGPVIKCGVDVIKSKMGYHTVRYFHWKE